MDAAHPLSVPRILGSALHAGLAAAYTAAPSHPGRNSLWRAVGPVAMAELERYLTENATWIRRVAYYEDARRMLQDILGSIPTPDGDAVLAVEKAFRFTHTGSRSMPVTGRFDLVMRTGMSGIHIRDWKLGDVPHRREELESNTQLAVYTAAARHLWPWAATVSVGLYSISKRREISTVLAPDSVTHALDVMEWDYLTAHGMMDGLTPTSGPHCGNCDYRAFCPLTRAGTYPVIPGTDVAAGIITVDRLLAAHPPTSP